MTAWRYRTVQNFSSRVEKYFTHSRSHVISSICHFFPCNHSRFSLFLPQESTYNVYMCKYSVLLCSMAFHLYLTNTKLCSKVPMFFISKTEFVGKGLNEI